MANASVTDRKLLFVDDDPAVLDALCPYFRARGNTVLTATDRKGALALLAEETFDAAVLDLVLPDGDGMQLFFEATRLPPVIILSTLDGEAAMLEGFSAGAVDYVVKPCSPALLEARIRAVEEAAADIRSGRVQPVPEHLKNVHVKAEGKAEAPAYKYPHDYEGAAVAQDYLTVPKTYYRPKPTGYEDTIAKRLAFLRARVANSPGATP